MPASGGFEPTEPQSGVDPNLFTLIDPDTIPYPLTDVWSLNYAAETLRSGGEDIAGDAEDMRSTWSGLQAHYSAPESEDLFSKMDPVVTRGEDVESDLVTVAEALEDLAEAATTARRKLNTLKIQAQGFHNRNQDKAVWWLTKDDKTDEAAFLENIRLKDEVNTAWAAFNEAENACASKISAVYGGAAYVSPDQARGDDVIVYGLPTDAGERDTGFTTLFTESANDMAAWFDAEYWVSPAEVTFDNSTGQAAWDIIVTDVLWGSAVGLVSLSGAWHPDNGWRLDPAGRWDNLKKSGWDTVVGAGTLVGVHDDQGWLFSSEGEGASWGRWTDNMGDVLAEGWEGNTAWSQKDEDPEYTGATSGINLVLLTVGLPLKALKTGLTLGPGGDVDGDGSDRSDLGDEDRSSPTGGRPLSGESSPWPRDGDARTPTTGERFGHDLDILRESLLDPNRYRDTPGPQPDRPSSGGDGAPAPRNPNTETPQGQGGTPDPDRPRGETSDALRTPEAAAPRGGRSRDDTTDAPRVEERTGEVPTGRRDTEERDDVRAPERDATREDGHNPQEEPDRPDPQAGGNGSGDDQPPRNRTSTGDDDDSRDDANDPNSQLSQSDSDPELERKTKKADELEARLRQAGLTNEDIDQLRGEHPRDGDQWQRAASAINQGFSKKLDSQLHPAATHFALEGAANPREFAYRYEYYKATFDELAREIQDNGFSKNQSQILAAQELPNIDITARLEADHSAISELRDGEPALVSTNLPHDNLEQAIRLQAQQVEMGHETATAYHARKHYNELPAEEKGGNVISDYLNSAEKTIREGHVSEVTPLAGGAQKWTFMRPVLDLDGNHISNKKGKPSYMRAFIIIRPDGTLVMPTYGMTTQG
ncbi:hypothetical protein [Nocardiopsis lambiniae]|uniref:Bacterial CdiA-CT RNAse A domain-containing protein n=1 Tax=Nocardiopsis lambiniae TaxID=3075539 RepID=A0ABU2MGA8_9ACTN|nr:hypothetical protein [Nocardiopsis sp. DSM 44743]MDT0331742.1 hypothetical protein [Nocardiopsis sp. DSM 44743]